MTSPTPVPGFEEPFPFRNLGLAEQGAVTGRRFDSGEIVRITWSDHVITSIQSAAAQDVSEGWLAPPLFDLQVNGYGGIDFQGDDFSLSSLEHAAACLQRDGCGRILLTLVTDLWSEKLLPRLARIRCLRDSSPMLRRVIAGWHIEGPFLSAEPGFKGAHDGSAMMDPSPARIAELRSIAGDDPLLLTLAPEREGSIESIRKARELGIRISFGHTNASADRLARAREAGGEGFTHFGNGCPETLNRYDNILLRVFEQPGLTVGIIPDGIHVSPSNFRLMHRVLDRAHIYYTTDAMSAAGAPPGRYRLRFSEVDVGEDRVVRRPGEANLAGSALRVFECVSRASRMLGVSWRGLWPLASSQPAKWIGLEAELKTGALPPILVAPETA